VTPSSEYNFVYLDEQTKRMIRRTILKGLAIPGYQVPIPEPLRFLEPRESETRKMDSLEEYGLMHVKLYEDISRHGNIATSYAYPVKVEGRYVMDASPIPKFDNPKLGDCPAIQLFGAGREQRVNIARGFAHAYPAMLLDEPTASLDAENREVVLALIESAKTRGAAIIGIFHDEAARARVCDREIDVSRYTPGVAA